MGRKTEIFTIEDLARAEKSLKEIGKESLIAIRLRIIISAYNHGIKKVSEIMDLSRGTVHRWMRNYKQEGLEGLLNDGKPSRSKLHNDQKARIKSSIEENPTQTLKEIVLMCREDLGLEIGKSSIHRFLKSIGYAHITGRKIHHKADSEKQEAFKKN